MRDGGRRAVKEAQARGRKVHHDRDLAGRPCCSFTMLAVVGSTETVTGGQMCLLPFGSALSPNDSFTEGLVPSSLLGSVGGTFKTWP